VDSDVCCDIILHTMSLIDKENSEWYASFGFSPDETQMLLEECGIDGEQMLYQSPQLVNIPIEELQRRIGILSASTKINTLTPNTTKEFLMLGQRRLGQLATLAVENDLTEVALVEIHSSPVGINAEILLRHIACTIEKNPYDKFLLGKRDEQLLISVLQYSKEKEDVTNIKRIEQILSKVQKCSEKKNLNTSSFKQPTLNI